MVILTANQIRKAEQICFEKYYDEAQLMLKAGTECYNQSVNKYGEQLKNATVNVFCGNGKNAGDGFVIARLLCNFGANAKIIICHNEPTVAEPVMYFNQAVQSGVASKMYDENDVDADFIVDTMFGIGFHGEAKAPFDEIFARLKSTRAKIIAIDTPSGTDSTTGEACENAVCADFTIAISTLKFAHVLPPANAHCGETVVVDIGIPRDCYCPDDYAKTIDYDDVKSSFSPMDKNSNKGTFGKQLNICGSYTMPGTAVICAKAALKSGVGLLKCATVESAYPIIASHLVEPIFLPLADGVYKTFSPNSAQVLLENIKWADSVVLGCGIGNNQDTQKLVKELLKNASSPLILDADGINAINNGIDILKDVKVPVVLTPHPGEMSRLILETITYVQQNRITVAKEFAKEYGVIVVLKGANTVVTDGKEVFVNINGNPGMAVAGCGDMLSGMIGAFIAQGISPLQAAKSAVFIHGMCGDITAEKISKRGMTVSDMLDQSGALMSEFE